MAWLDDDGPAADVRATKLCTRCGARFTVPLGWQLVDRSTPAPPPASQLPPTHPAVAVRGSHDAAGLDPGVELEVPDEDHPSGPLDLRNRMEPVSMTRELERLARHLDSMPSLDHETDVPGREKAIHVRRAVSHGPADAAADIDDDTFGDELDAEMTEELSIVGLSDRSWPNDDDDTQIRPPRWADPG